jgi:hypothetical protein
LTSREKKRHVSAINLVDHTKKKHRVAAIDQSIRTR